MAAFSLRKFKNKKEPMGFGLKSPAPRGEKRKSSSIDPDETQIPGSERDHSQTPIQPNAEKKVLNRKNIKTPGRSFRSTMREGFLRSKAMVGVWNVAVF